MADVQNLIGGEFLPAYSKSWLERKSPLNGETYVRVPDSDVLDVVNAIQAAHRAWAAWSRVESEARAVTCITIADRLHERAQELSLSICEESGITLAEAHRSVVQTITSFRHLGDHGPRLLKNESIQLNGLKRTSNLLPFGLVGIICPAYDPILTIGTRLAAALVSGNIVLAKGSSFAPQSSQIFAECVHNSGLPSGVFNLLQGRGESVGQAIVQHPGIAALSFAGKTSTGLAVHHAGAEFLKRTQLSMSASNPVLVFDGVDIERTAAQVARLTLTGEIAVHLHGTRVLVQESIYKTFLDAFISEGEMIAKRIGDPRNAEIRLGPLARKRDLKQFEDGIKQAVSESGKVVLGAQNKLPELTNNSQNGNFISPTIITDLRPCSTLYQQELLGPMALIRPFKYAHDAIKFANGSPLGAAAYLFHSDPNAAATIASRIESGRVFINSDYPHWDVHLGFNGIKMSGLGRESGLELMLFFSRQTVISTPI